MYKDNLTDAPRKRFDTLKKIWENKNIIIVEGSQTRLGVGNDLFANTKSIRRILFGIFFNFKSISDIRNNPSHSNIDCIITGTVIIFF